MICNRCGSKISKDTVYCQQCGNNIGSVNFDETNGYSTENNNTQINDALKVGNSSNQNIEPQELGSSNVNQQTRINKKRNNHIFLLMCGFAIFIIFVETIIWGYGYILSANNNTAIRTTYNGIKLPNTYANEAEGISFNYPKIWNEFLDVGVDGNVNGIICLGEPTEANMNSTMYVNKMDTNSNSIDMAYVRTKVKDYTSTDVELQEIIDTTINGVDAVKVITAPFEGYRITMYFYLQNGDIYQILFASKSDKFDAYEPIFNAIMQSYTITIPTVSTSQNQSDDDYGLSEEEALAAAQHFADTHPLYDRKITGYVLYEPQIDGLSTKGLYWVQTTAPDGSTRVIWVDKRTGSLFMMPKGEDKLIDAEIAYEKMFITN